MFGALGGILPLRLGGTDRNGWTAAQHARFAADLLAVQRTGPIATWTYIAGAIEPINYRGWNGVGPTHAPTVSSSATGNILFTWSDRGFPDPYDTDRQLTLQIKGCTVTAHGTTAVVLPKYEQTANTLRITTTDETGALVAGSFTVKIWGTVGDSSERAIGDYGGDPDKRDSETEGKAPYAARWLAEIRRSRGSAYTQRPDTLVHVENVALARLMAWSCSRLPEKIRANALPGTSDDKLEYWAEVLGITPRQGEPRWALRKRCASHYKAVLGNSYAIVREACEELLGDAFVDVTLETGADLDNPPTQTFWPTINPGDSSLSLGGGAWLSARSHVFVATQQPAGMSDAEYLSLTQRDAFQLLDRLLPAWVTFAVADADGFILGESLLGYGVLTD
jgi:hypothetical protein